MKVKDIEKFRSEEKGSFQPLTVFYVLCSEPTYTPIYFSPSIERFGHSVHEWCEVKNLDWSKFVHPEDREVFLADKLKLITEKKSKTSQYRIIGKNGEIHKVFDHSCFIDDKIHGVLIEAIDYKFIKTLLGVDGDFYYKLFEDVSDIVYLSDLQGKWVLVNPAVEKILGYTRDEILTQLRTEDIVAPEYLQLVKQKLEEKTKGDSSETTYDVQFIRKDGVRVTLEIKSRLLWGESGQPLAIQGIARDVTEKRKLVEALSSSEREIKAILSALPEMVFVVSNDGKIIKTLLTRGSATFHENLKKLVGKSIEEIILAEHLDFFLLKIRESLRKSKPVSFESEIYVGRDDVFYEVTFSPLDETSVVMVLRDITEKKFVMQALKESEERYRELFENANDLIYTHDLQGNYTEANRMAEVLTGYTKEEIKGLSFTQVVAPEHLDRAKEAFRRKLKTGESTTYELDVITKDGRRITLELRTRLIYRDGKPVGVQGIGRDITERKKMERALKESEERYRLVTEGVMHQIWSVFPDGKIEFVNSRVKEYFGCSLEDLENGGWQKRVHPEDLRKCFRKMITALRNGEAFDVELRLKRKDGQYLWHAVRVVPYLDDEGNVVKWFGTGTNIHDKKVAESELDYLAKHDSLTGLFNRSQFVAELNKAIEKLQEKVLSNFAVLFLDLDRFKVVNDSLGHGVGDEYLKITAERIKRCVRPRDVVARFGGDEFTVLLNGFNSKENVFKVADRILDTLSKPLKVKNNEIFTSASIGIVFSDEERKTPEDYLRDADIAMYKVKERGKSGYEVFSHEMKALGYNFLRLESDLRHSIKEGLFDVYYQPIVSLADGKTRGFEALLRWKHPELGLLPPEEFIDVAEETGLIVTIGGLVLEKAISQLRKWKDEFDKELFICVNLSAKQLANVSLVRKIKGLIHDNSLEPSSVCLELTESAVLKDEILAGRILNELDKIGIMISTDDFGTGHASLGYLSSFPFKWLKIDRSLISRINKDRKSELVVKALLMIGEGLGMNTVAEGIEEDTQLQMLKTYGCQFGQGFVFSKPLNAEEISKFFEKPINFQRA
ncbi:MAG: PAS domain S-box protein [Acidobacteriota bacterium]|nr:PAS domain S-box protein [Acidobacteriota bacterium]